MFRNLLIDIKHYLIYLIDSLFKKLPLAYQQKMGKCILVVRFDATGDFVIWLDAAKAIREYFPDHEITLVGNRLWTGMAKTLPYFDKVIAVKPKALRSNLTYRYRLFRQIRRESYDMVINPVYTRAGGFLDGEALLNISRGKQKIGFKNPDVPGWRTHISNRFYTKLLPATLPSMDLQKNAEFVRGLGFEDFSAGLPIFPAASLPAVDPALKYDYILFPGAGSPKRRWPVASFAQIATRIYQATGWKGLICGGPGEEQLGDELLKKTNVPLKNIVGTTSLAELATLITNARLLISNDTSAIHIAAAVATPSVCLVGGGQFGRFLPYALEKKAIMQLPLAVFHKMPCFNCDWHCKYPLQKNEAAPCIANIAVEDVWKQVEPLLKKTIHVGVK